MYSNYCIELREFSTKNFITSARNCQIPKRKRMVSVNRSCIFHIVFLWTPFQNFKSSLSAYYLIFLQSIINDFLGRYCFIFNRLKFSYYTSDFLSMSYLTISFLLLFYPNCLYFPYLTVFVILFALHLYERLVLTKIQRFFFYKYSI